MGMFLPWVIRWNACMVVDRRTVSRGSASGSVPGPGSVLPTAQAYPWPASRASSRTAALEYPNG